MSPNGLSSRSVLLLAVVSCLSVLLLPALPLHAGATDVQAFFREGQTFLTWKEDPSVEGEVYHVYRSTGPIKVEQLDEAERIATVPEGSCRFREMWTRPDKDGKQNLLTKRGGEPPAWVIPRLSIEPVGEDNQPKMLSEGTGLLVWTIQEPGDVNAYYAVTMATDGKEHPAETVVGPVAEKKQPIGAVHYYTQSQLTGRAKKARNRIKAQREKGEEPSEDDLKRQDEMEHRDWYIMWMDTTMWNVDYIGYAFPIALTRNSFKQGGKTPTMHLDGIGTMNAFTAWYTNFGQGDFSRNALPTWYFGYGTKVKDRQSGIDVKQPIANYVQYRIAQAVLWARRKYDLDDRQFHINGNSMGASGNIGLALAFPHLVTSIWSNQGMTDYADTFSVRQGRKVRLWASSIAGNYGRVDLANPVKLLPFGEEKLDWYLKHDGMNVYDFRNAAKFLAANVDQSFPLLLIGHTHNDGSIPAKNQAYPFAEYIRNSRHTFAYTIKNGGHGWGSALNGSRMAGHVYTDESRPGFSNVPAIVCWQYNKKLENSRGYASRVGWASSSRKIGGKTCVETEDSWSMPLIHDAKEGQEEDYFCDITPRNLQKLKVLEGERFTYRIVDLEGAELTPDFKAYANGEEARQAYKASGEIVADEHNLLLIPNVPIRKAGCVVEVTRAE